MMEIPTSGEDVLVVQTESGEQITLPISALPSDFVPGDSGQIIMVEGTLDEEQHAEIVVESCEVSELPVDESDDNQQEQASPEDSIIASTPPPPPVPRIKQKRKETLVTKPLNEEDVELEFQIIEEPLPVIREVEVKKKPRKEYKTKKVRMSLEKLNHERRTRLSNTYRVATSKSYKCNDCDFSTDRINNIIIHVKEGCPKLKKTTHVKH